MPKGQTFDHDARARQLHAEGKSCNAIAKELGVAPSTISLWAKREGLSFDRSQVVAANHAHSVDLAARRIALKELMLEDAHRLREQLWQPARLVNFGGKDNTLNETILDEPLFVDKKNLMSSVSLAVNAFEKLDARDNDNGAGDAKSMLAALGKALGIGADADVSDS